MKHFNKKQLKPALFMVLASVALFMVLIAAGSQFAEIEKLQNHLQNIDRDMWGILFIAALINYIARGSRWHFFAKKLNLDIPKAKMALYYATGFTLITTPGKIGTALRLWLIKRDYNYKYSQTTPMMVMDQLTDLIAMVLLSLIGLLSFHYIGITLFLAVGFLCSILLLLYKPNFILFILDILNKKINKPKFFDAIKNIIKSTNSLLSPTCASFNTSLSVIGWVVSSFSFYLLLQQLGADISFLSALFIFNCASILGALSMMPGGLGSAEIIMVGLLISVGVPNDIAIVSTAVIRGITVWFAVLIGFCVLPFGFKTSKK